SNRVKDQRELPAEGETYIAAMGGTVPAGQAIDFAVSGFPHRNRAPRIIALALAGAIIVAGVWMARRPDNDASTAAAERQRRIARREKLFADLVRLEHDRRNGRTDDRRYTTRRDSLVSALEQVYGALDDGGSVAA